MEYTLFNQLKGAYNSTTKNHNKFLEALNSVAWDATFYADGEHYYKLGGFILTVENTNPFMENWKPSAFFSDGAYLEF